MIRKPVSIYKRQNCDNHQDPILMRLINRMTQLASVISITATAHIIARTEYIRFRFPWKPIFRFHSK